MAVSPLKAFHEFLRQVEAAAGDLAGLPDGFAFEIVWRNERDFDPEMDPEDRQAFITAGMIRRARAALETLAPSFAAPAASPAPAVTPCPAGETREAGSSLD